MKEQNGVIIFEEDDKLPDLPRGLSADIKGVISRFGYKIAEVDGEPTLMDATERDYREAESKRLGISPEKVEVKDFGKGPGCYSTGPQSCAGHCIKGHCQLSYNPVGNYYYCQCVYFGP